MGGIHVDGKEIGLWEAYKALALDGSKIGLEEQENALPYFCYPVNAIALGYEGAILYCLLPGYGEMVFAANPETCAAQYVYPLAKNFADFLRAILACGSTNPVEQIIWMEKTQFIQHIAEERQRRSAEQEQALSMLQTKLGLTPMENVYESVKALQAEFDGSNIVYSEEYYEVLGLRPPEAE